MKISIKINSIISSLVKSNHRTAKVGRQIVYSFVLQGINIVVGFLYVPLLLNYLTQEKYGIWLTLTSILGWFSFFDIGLGNGLRNKLTGALATDNKILAKTYVSTTYALLISIFSIILISFHICNLYLNWNIILNTKTIANNDLYLLTSIVFTFFIIRFVVQLIGVIYLADQSPAVNNSCNTISSMLALLIVYFLTRITSDTSLLVIGSIISILPIFAFLLLSFYSFTNKYQFLRPSFKSINMKMSKDLMGLGVRFFFLQVTSIIIFSTSSIFISQLYGPNEVVIYNIAFKYFQIPIMIFTIIISPIWSAVTDAYVRNDIQWLKVTLRRLNYTAIVFAFLIVIMIIFSEEFFKIWIGNKVKIPFNLICFMAIYSILNILLSPYSVFINGLGKIKLTMSLTFIGIALYFILILYLSQIFHNSSSIIIAIIATSIIGMVIQPIQVYKILNKKAFGIWNK